MTTKRHFIETCVSLSLLDRQEILRLVLADKVKDILCRRDHKPESPEPQSEVPKNLDILGYSPTTEQFSDYAFTLCSLKSTKEEIVAYLIGKEFDKVMTPLISTTPVAAILDVDKPPVKRRRRLTILPPVSLPPVLSLFTYKKDDTIVTLTNMPEIIDRFFKGVTLVWQGIYADRKKSEYVLLVVDNGRYKNVWRSSGKQNRLTWYTSHEDTNRQEMGKIVECKSVHIVRKRNGEYRYMGKITKIDDVDYGEGSCVMLVS